MAEPLQIIHEDGDLLAVSKAAGVPAIPERYDRQMLSAFEMLKENRPGLLVVHRIDKETSGLLVFCKTENALRHLGAQFAGGDGNRFLRKDYLAILEGRPLWNEAGEESPLLPDADRRHRTIVSPDGKKSVTRFTVLERFRGHCFVQACPATGRTHQIRAHAARLGHPVLCDSLYGSGRPLFLSAIKRRYKPPAEGEKPLLARLALHAAALEFIHPASGRSLRLEAPLPKDLRAALAQLRKTGGA
ncbi:MAG: RluA family pseudouridine synthase [Spirochaetia bacterium]|jgi:RluA family pseudouridine synthase|nr:RluA family pseudouridine synthase [Spirochaetia bacterium]